MSGKPLSTYRSEDVFEKFEQMRIKHPHHEAALEMFEKLRHRKIRSPAAEQTAVSLFAGSQSGKTTTVRWYIDSVLVDEWLDAEKRKGGNDNGRQRIESLKAKHPKEVLRKLQRLALYVELSGETTISGLISDILEALGDVDPHSGTAKHRRYRAEKLLLGLGYQIIFLDETQHIKTQTFTGSKSRTDDATEVQNTLKRWIKRWPIVFVGTQHAEKIIFEHQVDTRSEKPLKFGPLHFGNEQDRAIFEGFCGRLCLKVAQHDILPEAPTILVEGDVPLCLNVATKGRLGLVTKLTRIAIEIALERGELKLQRHHFAKAVDDFAVRINLCASNPFTDDRIIVPSVEDYMRDDV